MEYHRIRRVIRSSHCIVHIVIEYIIYGSYIDCVHNIHFYGLVATAIELSKEAQLNDENVQENYLMFGKM